MWFVFILFQCLFFFVCVLLSTNDQKKKSPIYNVLILLCIYYVCYPDQPNMDAYYVSLILRLTQDIFNIKQMFIPIHDNGNDNSINGLEFLTKCNTWDLKCPNHTVVHSTLLLGASRINAKYYGKLLASNKRLLGIEFDIKAKSYDKNYTPYQEAINQSRRFLLTIFDRVLANKEKSDSSVLTGNDVSSILNQERQESKEKKEKKEEQEDEEEKQEKQRSKRIMSQFEELRKTRLFCKQFLWQSGCYFRSNKKMIGLKHKQFGGKKNEQFESFVDDLYYDFSDFCQYNEKSDDIMINIIETMIKLIDKKITIK